jgi:hypothetical protein
MTEQQLYIALRSGRLSKEKINDLVDELSKNPLLAKPLFQEVLQEDKAGDFNASWTFDHLMRKNLEFLVPILDDFTTGLSELRSDSCIRPIAHVCEMLCIAYFKKKDVVFQKHISDIHLEKILAACFDWLISPISVAPKVFSMTSLYYLGQKFDWVHPELRQVLEDTYASGSTGYKNRAKKTLDKLAQIGR